MQKKWHNSSDIFKIHVVAHTCYVQFGGPTYGMCKNWPNMVVFTSDLQIGSSFPKDIITISFNSFISIVLLIQNIELVSMLNKEIVIFGDLNFNYKFDDYEQDVPFHSSCY